MVKTVYITEYLAITGKNSIYKKKLIYVFQPNC